MYDSLGDRMKHNYEGVTNFRLPRRTYTILRLDGKAFHTYTRKCERPYDQALADAMDYALIALCKQIQGVKVGYTQSDEISLLLTDFDKLETDAWFDAQVQKMVSIAASIATANFNAARDSQHTAGEIKGEVHPYPALFDARVFTIPTATEVANYFIWRQKDAERNSIQSLAQAHFSQKQLNGKSIANIHDMLHDLDINWNDVPVRFKRGRGARRAQESRNWELFDPTIWTQDNELQLIIPPLPAF